MQDMPDYTMPIGRLAEQMPRGIPRACRFHQQGLYFAIKFASTLHLMPNICRGLHLLAPARNRPDTGKILSVTGDLNFLQGK
jgi:hypothetical protein